MKNKLFTILIVLAMVAAILPAYKVKAEETGHKHCICGAQHTEKGDHISDTQTEYSTRLYMKDGKLMMGDGEWETRETALTPYVSYDAYSLESGNYYLDTDLEFSYELIEMPVLFIDGDVNLCLNGHSILLASSQSSVISVIKGKSLTLTDCKGGGNISHKGTYSAGHGITIRGTFNMYGGNITNNFTFGVTNNIADTANNGGGVFIEPNCTMNMYGGTITNNKAVSGKDSSTGEAIEGHGGGVYVSKDSEFNMYGGEISGNKSNLTGGGVYNLGTMTVSGDAKISGNGKNSRNYSNAYMGEGGTLTIGGKLTGKIGVSKYDSKVGDVVVTGADADKDYSAIFFSDNFNFDVKHDGNNIVLIPHTHVLGEWEHNGILHWHECGVCSKVLDDAEHTWDEGVITKEPTTDAEGEKTFTCDVCKATKTEAIDKLPVVNDEIQDGSNNSQYTDTSDKNQNNGTTGEQNNDTSAITSPETGDKMNLVLWIALLVVSASTVIGTAVVNRKTI